MKKQNSLRDLSRSLNAAFEVLEEIQQRAVSGDEPERTFQQKVIHAAKQMEEGDPMKDFLTYEEVEQAVKALADIYIVAGVKMPKDWY